MKICSNCIINDYMTVKIMGSELPAFYSGGKRIPYKYYIMKDKLLTLLEDKLRYWYLLYKKNDIRYYREYMEVTTDGKKVKSITICPNDCKNIMIFREGVVPFEMVLKENRNAEIILPTNKGEIKITLPPKELKVTKYIKIGGETIEL